MSSRASSALPGNECVVVSVRLARLAKSSPLLSLYVQKFAIELQIEALSGVTIVVYVSRSPSPARTLQCQAHEETRAFKAIHYMNARVLTNLSSANDAAHDNINSRRGFTQICIDSCELIH